MAKPPDDPVAWGVHPRGREIVARRERDAKTFWLPGPGKAEPVHTTLFGKNLHFDGGGGWDTVELRFVEDGVGGWHAPKAPYSAAVGALGVEIAKRENGRGLRWLTDRAVTVDPGTGHCFISGSELVGTPLAFLTDGLHWYLTRSGLKFKTRISSPIGQRGFAFPFAKLGAGPNPSIDAAGNVVFGTDFFVRKPYALGADGETYEGGGWEIGPGARLGFTWDDSTFPAAAFPYVLDPTTEFPIGVSSDDGYTGGPKFFPVPEYWPWDVTAENTVSETLMLARTHIATRYYDQRTVHLRWDTSSLPSTVDVLEASLLVYIVGADNADFDPDYWYRDDGDHDIAMVWRDFGDTIDAETDHVFDESSPDAGLFDITTLTLDGVHEFVLTDADTAVNKDGNTGLRILIDGVGLPTDETTNTVAFPSFDTTLEYPIPILAVTHTAPPVEVLVARTYVGTAF